MQLGKMLSSKARAGISPKPYLRNKNVQWGAVDVTDVIAMDFSEREARKFRLRHHVVPAFMLYFLQRQYRHLRQMSVGAGSTKKALTCGLLKRYLVPVPTMVEQESIAIALDAVDSKATRHARLAECLRNLFRALLHQLMTAQIRVSDLDLAALTDTALAVAV